MVHNCFYWQSLKLMLSCENLTISFSDIATVGAVAISAPQFSSSQQSFISNMGPCFYIEVSISYKFYFLISPPLSTPDLLDIVQLVAGGALLRVLQEGFEDKLPSF